jgi:hypothetical protein
VEVMDLEDYLPPELAAAVRSTEHAMATEYLNKQVEICRRHQQNHIRDAELSSERAAKYLKTIECPHEFATFTEEYSSGATYVTRRCVRCGTEAFSTLKFRILKDEKDGRHSTPYP